MEKKNPKKVITTCPLKKEKGAFVKSECPAIKNVRNLRRKLNTLERTGKAEANELEKLRKSLRDAKTDEAKDKFCSNCFHKNQ
ncbi:MAG: hypothetical protein RDV48_16710 [Candidatus Eremiobacteraeota bacterium]|nr:hypothetical protein [Candidatus Eremiobacteraeota bacterium]